MQQINHSGGKCLPDVIGCAPFAPSALEYNAGVCAQALTVEEIARIEDAFAAAAVRAQQAGYDGVQVHCAHGYLFSEFIDRAWNKRTDAYGGAGENRFRIVRETLEKIRAAVGDFPVFLKIHTNAAEGDEIFASELGQMLSCARLLGVTAAELSGFDFARRGAAERLYYLDRAARVHQAAGLPVIPVGGIRSLDEMQTALDRGAAMVSLSRPFICQPDYLHVLRAGGSSACVGCYGCFSCYQKTGKRCILHK